jgi:hypothetical protein
MAFVKMELLHQAGILPVIAGLFQLEALFINLIFSQLMRIL